MNPTMKLKRVAALAALGTVGVLAPVASASAAFTPLPSAAFTHVPSAGFHLPGAPFPGRLPVGGLAGLPPFAPVPLSFVGPAVGQVAAVIGPTVITTAPSTFTNTNIQVSAGSNGAGGQAGA